MHAHQLYQEKYSPLGSIDSGSSSGLPIKVYSDYVQVLENLSDKTRFQLVDNPKDALIFWSSLDYYEIVRSQVAHLVDESTFYLNQFQYEAAYVNKHHLANLVRLTLAGEDKEVI